MARNTRLLAAAVLALALLSACGSSKPTSHALDPGELQSQWWTWARISDPKGPVADMTGRHCGEHQPSGRWFVAGTFGATVERSCMLPAGVPVIGPAVNIVVPTLADCRSFLTGNTGKAVLDGKPQRLVRIGPTKITYDDLGQRNGGYGCGLWAELPGLSAGRHTLVLEGAGGVDFFTKATYKLNAVSMWER